MISLNNYINESLLDDLEDLEKNSDNVIEKELLEKFLDKNYRIDGKYTIKNGVVDVKGSVTVKNRDLTELTNGLFVFGNIDDSFYCYSCEKLKSLKGAPKEVGKNFYCYECDNLKTLEGSPVSVGRSFYCSYCKSLTSLKGAPKKVGIDFHCGNCGVKFTEEQVSAVSNAKYIVV